MIWANDPILFLWKSIQYQNKPNFFANAYKHEMSQVEQIILFICDVAQQILLNKIKVDRDKSFAENLR